MVKQYFGTDGIRGRVGVAPMTPENVLKLGWAAGKVLAKKEGRKRGKVLIGKDTRISGYMMESLLEAGFSAAGVDSRLLGPMPTPAIAYLTRTFRASAGVVISASHNPYYDNGVKFFDANGEKLPDDVELDIEAQMQETMQTVDSADIGKVKRLVDATGRYIEFCKSTVPTHITFSGLKIVVDCAHGASYSSAPNVFRELGATVIELGVKPNGLNINKEYGATAPEKMRQAVLKHKADLGVALDGDGDRLILVDHLGNIVDGDQTLFIISQHKHLNNALVGGVVGTQMTNYGLEKAFAQQNIDFVRAKVGDRYVMEELRARNWMLGGESSGHIICLDCTTTGDGIIAALQVLCVMMESGKQLNDLANGFTMYPQIMLNVPIKEKFAFEESASINSAVKQVEDKLSGSGRVLLRASGTEPLIRVMVEGEEHAKVSEYAQHIADAVHKVCA